MHFIICRVESSPITTIRLTHLYSDRLPGRRIEYCSHHTRENSLSPYRAYKMTSKIFISTLFFLALSYETFANTPKFSDYRIKKTYERENKTLVITDSAGPYWDNLRMTAAKKSANFAGHYILFTGNCAGASVCGEVIDARTGKIIKSLPNVYQAYNEDTEEAFDIEHKVDSRLIVIRGTAQNNEPDINNDNSQQMYRTRYYEFNEGNFHLLFSDDN